MVRQPSIVRQLKTATENPTRATLYGLGKIQQQVLDLFKIGSEIYSESWDLLIILDACRADIMKHVASDYGFMSEVATRYSKASNSRQFMRRNFKDEYSQEMSGTAYISANTFSEEMFDHGEFAYLDHVWRYAYDEQIGTIPPRPVTDRAIAIERELEFDRMIVHYMQPHSPLITNPDFNYLNMLKEGEISQEKALAAHEKNLRIVLDEVRLLLKNIDANTTVISADHGESFGEWGVYGHQPHSIHPSLRRVPWIKTSASDSCTHEPGDYERKKVEVDVEAQLEALGY